MYVCCTDVRTYVRMYVEGIMSKVMKSFICRGCLNSVTSSGGDVLSVDGDTDAAVKARV